MIRSVLIFAILLCSLFATVRAEDSSTSNPKKYPQDTPEKALESVKKALESDDLAYWIFWLITPRDNMLISTNYKSAEDAAKAMQASKSVVAENTKLSDSIRELSSRCVTETGEEDGVKWKRLFLDDKKFFQLEQQKDGRWCLNLRARSTAVKK